MKKRTKFLLIVILLIFFCVLTGYVLEDTKDFKSGNLFGGQEEFLIVLTGKRWEEYGKEIVIYSLENGKKEIFRKNIENLKPWSIQVGDVDYDNIDEIGIGVYKESPLHPIMAKRPFIYNFDGLDLMPKWRGSRLSRPFSEFVLFDIDNDGTCEIVSIEELEDGRNIVNSYKWKGFGFEGFEESEIYEEIYGFKIQEGDLKVLIKDGNKNVYIKVFDIENEKEGF